MRFTESALQAGRALESIIVPHTNFESVADYLTSAVQIGTETGIFSGVRVSAPSGAGKSSLLKYVALRLRQHYGEDGTIAMITASLKENPSVSQIQGELLANFNYPLTGVSRLGTNNDVNIVLVRAIEHHRVKLVALDEFQHVFLTGGPKVATTVIDWLKRLMNLTKVPVTLVGTEAIDRLTDVDPQLTSRIPTVVRLTSFQLDEQWKGFLRALAQSCVEVDLTEVHSQHAVAMFRATKGSPRLAKGLLIYAVAIALTSGAGAVSIEVLREAYRMQIGPTADRDNPFVIS
ncbi:TniB family NTP-binding protein [Bordetella genomosp. 11]|jgi:hypothetical protein|uniref:AAA+ ATPase domain-containing protein n=1 Tax=Bordetella genomosp. 11 TaxID=1416808 RepID=A0A261UXU5_9BORD|nr:TniB family NTP-binding protein [Bordetella genomosp. 11]OZI66704.1 hypothetical protein CAL28_02990 [Bordetella genomosp. 11]